MRFYALHRNLPRIISEFSTRFPTGSRSRSRVMKKFRFVKVFHEPKRKRRNRRAETRRVSGPSSQFFSSTDLMLSFHRTLLQPFRAFTSSRISPSVCRVSMRARSAAKFGMCALFFRGIRCILPTQMVSVTYVSMADTSSQIPARSSSIGSMLTQVEPTLASIGVSTVPAARPRPASAALCCARWLAIHDRAGRATGLLPRPTTEQAGRAPSHHRA